MKCQVCGEVERTVLDMAFHFRECEKAEIMREEWRKQREKERKERLKGFKL
jgi:hypothetical protein